MFYFLDREKKYLTLNILGCKREKGKKNGSNIFIR